MTTLNAKANAAYHALIDEYEREHPDGVWLGFDHQRDAYEQGWEDGHEARLVPERATLAKAAAKAILYNLPIDAFGDEKRLKDYAAIWGNATADAVLALLNGTDS